MSASHRLSILGLSFRARNTRETINQEIRNAKAFAAEKQQRSFLRKLIPFFLLLLVLAATGCGKSRVVLYCAQDREIAEDLLHAFDLQSGWPVSTRFDSEANKAVGLYEDLVREARQPRCDVYWNNEILATLRLAKQDLLEPYDSPAAAAFPAQWRAKNHTWHAFAARARVLLLNTKLLHERGFPEAEWPSSLEDLTNPRWHKQVGMAKPVAGTSATQAACLFVAWGEVKTKAWYHALHQNGVQLVAGNKQAAEGVSQGQFLIGLTDTDDAMAEIDDRRPVRLIFPDANAPVDSGRGTLFIPNSVAIMRGAPHREGARRLVDYLLSKEVETALAKAGYHLPLNPAVQVEFPEAMRPARTARQLSVDFERAAESWENVQAFLRAEFGW